MRFTLLHSFTQLFAIGKTSHNPVVRETIVNAITHRDYFSKDVVQIYLFDDRFEITNQ